MQHVQSIVTEAFRLSQKGNARGALTLLHPFQSQYSKYAPFLYVLGVVYHQLGDLEKAERCFKKGRKIAPQDLGIASGLGLIFMSKGQYSEALQCFENLLRIHNDPSFLNNKGICLERLGRIDNAFKTFSLCIQHYPQFMEGFFNRAQLYEKIGNFHKALDDYKRVSEGMPLHTKCWCAMGNLYLLLGHFEEASSCFVRAEQQRSTEGSLGLARVFIAQGDLEKAYDVYKLLEQNQEQNSALFYCEYADLLSSMKNREESKILYEKGLEKAKKEDKTIPLLYAMGKAYHALGQDKEKGGKDYKKALDCYDEAHILEQRYLEEMGCAYDIKASDLFVSNMIQSFDGMDFLDFFPDKDEPTPIFVVGMPRSGTSLVEQILSAHSLVSGAGERKVFPDIVSCIEQNSKGWSVLQDKDYVAEIRKRYREGIRIFKTPYVVDKLPGNFLFIGLIKKIFPRAIIIHTERNPFDTCLSIYSQYFSADIKFHHTEETLAHYYQHVYRRMMRYWEACSIDFLTLSYDDLVFSPREKILQLLGYAHLEEEDACFASHLQKKTVNTASRLQVRGEIYKRSSGRALRDYPMFVERLKPYMEI